MTTKKPFYRAMLCIRGTSHGPVSVCPSITSRCSIKTAKLSITQTTPHDSTGNLVFWTKDLCEIRPGSPPYGGAKCRWGGSKSRLLTNNRLYLDKKPSYRRWTARCLVSVEILPIATQQCRNYLYYKSWTKYQLSLIDPCDKIVL